MRLATSGEICSIFKEADEGTIVRRPNLRRFARDNGVEHYVIGDKWLISKEEFFIGLYHLMVNLSIRTCRECGA